MSTKLCGVMSSECVDSENDVFRQKGMSIEYLKGAIVNSEHEKSFTKTIGKIIEVKKIYSEEDCKTDQERGMLTKNNKMPFLYGVVELFDDTQHLEAKSVAAIVEFHKSAEAGPLPLFFSIECEPVSVNSNKVYELSVAKRVALCRLPANKACIVEVYNPGPGMLHKSEKEEVKMSKEDVDSQLQEVIGNLVSSVKEMTKSLEAGYNFSPAGTATQGAALQKGALQCEDSSTESSTASEEDKKRFRNVVKSIVKSVKLTKKV